MLVAALTALSYAELGSRFPQWRSRLLRPAFHTDWLSILVGWLMFCTCLVSMATLSKAFAGYLNTFAPVIPAWLIILALFLVLHLSISEECRSPQPSTFLHGLEVSGLLIVILVSTLFLIGSGAGAGNPTVSLGSSQQAMGWTGVFQGAALAFYAFIGFEDIVNVLRKCEKS